MTREEIMAELKQILSAVNGIDVNDIHCDEETLLLTGLGLNSIGMLYMVISIENKFGFRFEDLNMDEMDTVGKVIDRIESVKR